MTSCANKSIPNYIENGDASADIIPTIGSLSGWIDASQFSIGSFTCFFDSGVIGTLMLRKCNASNEDAIAGNYVYENTQTTIPLDPAPLVYPYQLIIDLVPCDSRLYRLDFIHGSGSTGTLSVQAMFKSQG